MVSHVWPVPNTPTSYYAQKDGRLTLALPKDEHASLTYVYDPRNAVPSMGGNWAIGDRSGPHDQRPLRDRMDILRFATEPLAEPVGITGKVWVELAFSSDAPDTMFTVKLIDIYPDGYEAVYRESAGLARYWQGLDKPAPLQTGRIYRLMLDCWSTALVFGKGHRIGLHISSSSDPAYEVHPNRYEQVDSTNDVQVAHNTIHMCMTNATRLILPVVSEETYLTGPK
jgi:putative CocE/NonD family hydrolase